MTITIIVANDKGGVGKSTVAQFCASELLRRLGDVHVVEFDNQHRLKRFFDAANVTSVQVTPESGLRAEIWDPLLEWLDDGRPAVIDLGARMWDEMGAWATVTSPGEIVDTTHTTVLVPFTADPEAVSGAQRIADSVARVLPGARLIALAIDKDGDVAMLSTSPLYRALVSAVEGTGGAVRAFPVMAREGYPVLAALGLRFDQIAAARPKEIAAVSGLPPAIAARTVSAVRAWVEAARQSLDTLLPPASAAIPEAPSCAAASEPVEPPRAMVFDEAAYLALYPDVATAVAAGAYPSGRQHYLERGMREGRVAPSMAA